MKLDIIYEDNHIIVVFKESGMLSQEDISKDLDILTLIKQYLVEKYNKPGAAYLGLVHRLDRNTSGLMVFAKTSKAASRLSEQIRNNSFNKEYLAVVEGNMKVQNDYITLKNNLEKNEKLNKSFISNSKNAKEAILEYKVLANKDNKSLVKVNLITGRHHQIRVQFSNMNYPLYGDVKYGSKNKIGNYYPLCAYKLQFIHPTTKEELKFIYMKDTKVFSFFGDNLIEKFNL